MQGRWSTRALVSPLFVLASTAQVALPLVPPGAERGDGDDVRRSRAGHQESSQAADMDGGPTEPVALRVHLYVDGKIDPSVVGSARLVAEGLLSAAGVATTWSTGNHARDAVAASERPDVVTILRSGVLRSGRRSPCGFAARDEHHVGGSVVVSVQCVADFAFRLSRSDDGRHPWLAMPRHDDLVGVVIAHEFAHLLGLRHASEGVMRSGLHAEDLVALRAGRLAFQRQEVMTLVTALARARVRSRVAQGDQPPRHKAAVATLQYFRSVPNADFDGLVRRLRRPPLLPPSGTGSSGRCPRMASSHRRRERRSSSPPAKRLRSPSETREPCRDQPGALPLHPQIRLMHERGPLEGVVRTFSPQPRLRPAAELCVHRGKELITRLESGGAPVAQQTSDVARRTAVSVVGDGCGCRSCPRGGRASSAQSPQVARVRSFQGHCSSTRVDTLSRASRGVLA